MNKKKHFSISMLSTAVYLGLSATPVSAELSTQVIQDLGWPGYYVYALANPTVDGDTVAWTMNKPGYGNNKNVYYWDGATIRDVGFNNEDTIEFDLDDGTIAWLNNTRERLYYWNGTYDTLGNPAIETIVDNSSSGGTAMFGVSLDNGKIVWAMHDGQDEEIHMWDGTYNSGQPHIVQITDNDYQDAWPTYSDGMLAWRAAPSPSQLSIHYWDGANIHELNGPGVANEYYALSTSNGGVAWKSSDRSIYYWDGTFDTSSNPNIVTVDSSFYLGVPTLDNGKITYYKHDAARPAGQDEAVFYWNGSTTFQVSEWYNAYNYLIGGIRARSSSGGLTYVGINATTNTQEIRFVTSSGLCL